MSSAWFKANSRLTTDPLFGKAHPTIDSTSLHYTPQAETCEFRNSRSAKHYFFLLGSSFGSLKLIPHGPVPWI
jgi:hypothetical protein